VNPADVARRAARHVEMLLRGERHPRYLYDARPARRRHIPLVRVLCGRCGTLAAVIEDHGRSGSMVLAGDCRYTLARLDMVACPVHGQLAAGWDRLAPEADRARQTRRTRTVPAKPLSMP
jgi:hypothetical protein